MPPAPRPPQPVDSALKIPFARLYRLSPRQLVIVGASFAALVSVIFFSPRFWLWRGFGVPLGDFIALQPEFHRAFHILRQLQDPWQKIDDVVNRVIEWRLLFPVLGHYTAMPTGLYFALPQLGCLLALGAVAALVWRETQEAFVTVAATLLAATTSWFFVASGWLGYFDSWLILALLGASFARARWLLFTTALLAPWIDERFILAAPLCLAVRAFAADSSIARDGRTLGREALLLAAGLAPYIMVRLGAEFSHTRETSTSYWANRPLLPASPLLMLWGLWAGLRLGWIAVGLAGLALVRDRRWLVLGAIVASLAVNVCVADDVSRSASVAIPVLVAGVLLLSRTQSARARGFLGVLCLGNLLLPAEHFIAAPDSAEEPYHRVPILSLGAEIARADDPPYFASPFAYNRRGMDAFQAGNQAQARAEFDLALRFDPHFSRAHANRGILRYMNGDADGLAELDQALAQTPWIYEARMQRAAFRQQAGNLTGALEDVRHALHYMPKDWVKRKDAEQYEQALAAQLAARP